MPSRVSSRMRLLLLRSSFLLRLSCAICWVLAAVAASELERDTENQDAEGAGDADREGINAVQSVSNWDNENQKAENGIELGLFIGILAGPAEFERREAQREKCLPRLRAYARNGNGNGNGKTESAASGTPGVGAAPAVLDLFVPVRVGSGESFGKTKIRKVPVQLEYKFFVGEAYDSAASADLFQEAPGAEKEKETVKKSLKTLGSTPHVQGRQYAGSERAVMQRLQAENDRFHDLHLTMQRDTCMGYKITT